MTNGEAREMARGLVRGSIIEDAASQFIALVLKETHDSRIKPLRAEVEALTAKLAEVEAERDAFASNIPDAAQNLIRNAQTGRLKALHRVKALVEATKEVKADCIARADKHGVVPIGRGAWDQLTAALSALEENK